MKLYDRTSEVWQKLNGDIFLIIGRAQPWEEDALLHPIEWLIKNENLYEYHPSDIAEFENFPFEKDSYLTKFL
jgi:hypothetical protein